MENDDSVAAMGRRLKHIRKMAKLTLEELALKADVGVASLIFWEKAKGSGPMRRSSMIKIISAIKKTGVECSLEWFISGKGKMPFITSEDIHKEHNSTLRKQISKEIEFFTDNHKDTIILEVSDDSMSPAIIKGDVVGGYWVNSSKIKNNGIYIVDVFDSIEIRFIEVKKEPRIFSASNLNFDINAKKSMVIDNLKVDRIALIARIWRLY